MSRDHTADLNENWAAWLDFTAAHAPGGASRTFGAIRCAFVGVPMPLFNQAFVFEAPAASDLAEATKWFEARDVPFWVTTPASHASSVAEVAEQAGLDPDTECTRAWPSPRWPTSRRSRRARRRSSASQNQTGCVMSRSSPRKRSKRRSRQPHCSHRPRPWTTTGAPGSWATSTERRRHADSCSAIGTSPGSTPSASAGLPAHARAAITAAVLAAGHDAGCSVGILQASTMGQPVYDRMGFHTVTQYHHFSPPERTHHRLRELSTQNSFPSGSASTTQL
ncbi:MAG: hypothetical protein R2695_07650 [Acidimicrobiales bacterium]